GGDARRGAGDLDPGHRPDLGLPLVALVQFLGGLDGALLDAHGFIEADQVPIEVKDRGHRRRNLQLQLKVAHFQVVFGDLDIAAVYAAAAAYQQVLRDVEVEVAAERRVEQGGRAVDSIPGIRERQVSGGPGQPLAADLNRHAAIIVRERGRPAEDRDGLR